jgi:hypothetical protein
MNTWWEEHPQGWPYATAKQATKEIYQLFCKRKFNILLLPAQQSISSFSASHHVLNNLSNIKVTIINNPQSSQHHCSSFLFSFHNTMYFILQMSLDRVWQSQLWLTLGKTICYSKPLRCFCDCPLSIIRLLTHLILLIGLLVSNSKGRPTPSWWGTIWHCEFARTPPGQGENHWGSLGWDEKWWEQWMQAVGLILRMILRRRWSQQVPGQEEYEIDTSMDAEHQSTEY